MISNLKKEYEPKLRANASDTYSQYLAKSGIDSDREYLDTIAEADAARQISRARSVNEAESLSSMGLSSSGYAEYLRESRDMLQKANTDSAEAKRAENDYLNVKGYEEYLSDYDKLQQKISQGVIEEFAASGSLSLEDAYKRAIFAGVGEVYAMQTASKAQSAAIENALSKAISYAKLYSLSAQKAKEYALSLGLPEFYAKKVYNEISTFNEEQKSHYSSMTPEEYYDYILSQK